MADTKDRVYLRKNDGSGAGYIFKREDANKFMKLNPGLYTEESAAAREANQKAEDAEAAKVDAADATARAASKKNAG